MYIYTLYIYCSIYIASNKIDVCGPLISVGGPMVPLLSTCDSACLSVHNFYQKPLITFFCFFLHDLRVNNHQKLTARFF